jgi:hypothetical protein
MDWYEMMKTLSGPFSQKQDPNRVSPVDKPGLDLLEKDEVKTKRPSMWNIVFSPYPASAGCATAAGSRRTRLAPPGKMPVFS